VWQGVGLVQLSSTDYYIGLVQRTTQKEESGTVFF
jgi:hypothetical protein